MGRDVAGLRVDKKPILVNVKSNGTAHVAPKVTPEKVATKDYEPEDLTVKEKIELNEKQDAIAIKNKNNEPEEKVIQPKVQMSTSPVKPESSPGVKEISDANSIKEPKPKVQMSTSPVKPESSPGVKEISDANSIKEPKPKVQMSTSPVKPESSPGVKEISDANSIKELIPPKNQMYSNDHANGIESNEQENSPLMATKQSQPNSKLYYDEEDNWSMASSTATSRTLRSKVTVPVAPRFTVTDRLQRRKEFYTKLEEKHKALEKERLEYEARTREEEEAAIKQLRKNMVVKAKPVPNFYREGPPPKVELKKLPVTRAKSPNLTRRKSFGDALKSTPEEKGSLGRATRQSVGVYKEGKSSPVTPKSTPKSKERVTSRFSNGNTKTKDRVKEAPQKVNDTKENSQVKEQGTTDVTIES